MHANIHPTADGTAAVKKHREKRASITLHDFLAVSAEFTKSKTICKISISPII